jgi:hypothetical protein
VTLPQERIAAGGPVNSQAQPGDRTMSLGDILERVLDKGLVIAGDIRVNLLDIELLTIKLRLVIASLETAKEVGIDWWEHDPWLRGGDGSDGRQPVEENQRGQLPAGSAQQSEADADEEAAGKSEQPERQKARQGESHE